MSLAPDEVRADGVSEFVVSTVPGGYSTQLFFDMPQNSIELVRSV